MNASKRLKFKYFVEIILSFCSIIAKSGDKFCLFHECNAVSSRYQRVIFVLNSTAV